MQLTSRAAGHIFIQVRRYSGIRKQRNKYLRESPELHTKPEIEQLRRVFAIFDKNKDGIIDQGELETTLEAFSEASGDSELPPSICDTVGSGNLDFDRFCTHLCYPHNEDDRFAHIACLLYVNEDFRSRIIHARNSEGFICDMDGVIYRGGELIPGVSRFLSWIEHENKKFTFLTNNSKHTPKQLQQRVLKMGLTIPEDLFLTSAHTTASFLLQQKPYDGTCFIIGGEGLKQAMKEVGFTETDMNPDYVILGESDSYNHDDICKATNLVHKGSRLICTNPDVSDPIENGSIEPSSGAWVSVIEVATGKKAYFPGKPNPLMLRSALEKLQLHSSQAVMIGDRMETDILSAIEANLHPILVLSGVTDEKSLANYPYRPYLVLNDVGMIPPTSFIHKE